MVNYQLISKLDKYITNLSIVKEILIKAPDLNIDAKLVVKNITNIDIDKLDTLLDNL